MNFKARLKALEQRRQASNRRMRLVVSILGIPLNLANSTCERTLGANGLLTEIVMLDGSDRAHAARKRIGQTKTTNELKQEKNDD